MGGLRRHLPLTHATFAVAVLAIAGIPPFAGFFSKDAILAGVLALAGQAGSPALLAVWAAGVLTAGLTAFYMTRLYLLVFAGVPRMPEEARHHLHESPPVMTRPLIVLALGAAVAGFVGVPEFLGGGSLPNWLQVYLSGTVPSFHPDSGVIYLSEWSAMAIALLVSVAGIAAAWAMYGRRPLPAPAAAAEARGFVRLIKEKFFVDEAIDALVLAPYRWLCRASAAFDEKVVDGLVNAAAAATDLASQLLRLVQTGYVAGYAFAFFLGTVVVLFFVMR